MGSKSAKLKRGDVFDVTVEKLVYGGQGITRHEGCVIFLDRVAPGDRLKIRVRRVRKSHAEADVLEVLEPGESRIEPPCPVFGVCGGCSWQHLDYAARSQIKAAQVREVLERIGGLTDMPDDFYKPVVAAPHPFHYRNKLDYSFGFDDKGEPALGFHWKGDFRKIVPIPGCLIHPEPFDKLLELIREWMAEFPEQLTTYNKRSHQGYLRSFVVRHSQATDQSMGMLITNTDDQLPGGGAEGLSQRIRERLPEWSGLVHGVNSQKADVAMMEREVDRWGSDSFDEKLDDFTFKVTLQSFFQTNTLAAAQLYRVIREEAQLNEKSIVLDAYCGTGSIGIFCGSQTKFIYGIEITPEAIWDARGNAKRNGLADRSLYWAGDVKEMLPQLKQHLRGRKLTHLIIDPPRGGMHKKALEALLQLYAKRLVYVSCNPSTMARDLIKIREAGYRPESVTPVDLFPQTYHIEAVMPFVLEGKTG
jgi:23S rRNA (uracil1939-C5)-methyltransferase